MKKKLIAVFAAVAIAATTFATPVATYAASAHWEKSGSNWKYVNETGDYATDGIWIIDDVSYCFNGNGIMLTGWQRPYTEYGDLSWFYFDANGKGHNGWLKDGGKYYYIQDGRMLAGESVVDNGTAYLLGTDGVWVESGSGWKKVTTVLSAEESYDSWYYFESGNRLATGWRYISGNWYYFGEGGYMCHSGTNKIKGIPYYFNSDGSLSYQSGWVSQTYHFTDGGSLTTWYYGNGDGTVATGWKAIGGKWYYFSDFGQLYYNEVMEIGGKYYAFRSDGAMVANGWYAFTWTNEDGTSDSDWYYAKSDGTLATGWNKINGKWYYFYQENTPVMAEEEYYNENTDSVYFFDNDGALRTGWVYSYDSWYYYTENGDQVKGWRKIGGKWYYFDEDYGYLYTDGWWIIDGTDYEFDADGVWIS